MNRALVPIAPNAQAAHACSADDWPVHDCSAHDYSAHDCWAQNYSANGRGRADFIAHLIATSEQAPQTRVRRRAEPEQVIAAYEALVQRPTRPGGALSRSL